MKKVFLSVLCCFLLFSSASAHPGKTDAYGGHTDRSTGEYHYHHGYNAHQHLDGICPYENYAAQTDVNSDAPSTTPAKSLLWLDLIGISFIISCINQFLTRISKVYTSNTIFRVFSMIFYLAHCILLLPYAITFLFAVFARWMNERAEANKAYREARLNAIRRGELQATQDDLDEMDNISRLRYQSGEYDRTTNKKNTPPRCSNTERNQKKRTDVQ